MKKFFTLLALCASLVSCSGFLFPDRKPEKWDRVMILYSAGFNDIHYYLSEDIKELTDVDGGAYIPARGSRQALLIYSHQTVYYGNYQTATSPALEMVTYDPLIGALRRDTLYRAPEGTLLTEKEAMRNVLEMIRDAFPSKHYGLILASHGTGWMPEGSYKQDSKNGSSSDDWIILSRQKRASAGGVLPGTTLQSFGAEVGSDGTKREMDIKDLAEALPMHFDYIYFDACLMGGIEVAYELKDKTDLLGLSPAEVPGSGMDYTTVAARLLKPEVPDLKGLCKDYFNCLSASSATVALLRCDALPSLAEACRGLFEKYSDILDILSPRGIQRFYRENYHWFYDLRDILVHCGATDADLAELDGALSECIIYKAATAEFMKDFRGFDINTYCGLSMYLPSNGSEALDEYYATLAWNKATGLVK